MKKRLLRALSRATCDKVQLNRTVLLWKKRLEEAEKALGRLEKNRIKKNVKNSVKEAKKGIDFFVIWSYTNLRVTEQDLKTCENNRICAFSSVGRAVDS